MPQISKIRIVNFKYNDGNRLIADELYDFMDKSTNKPKNALINLANGGGKSVLVQLMLQPIVPKAKVSGRKIESFFTKNDDHCYILLEWVKDNSTEKLLTGISMAASDASIERNDDERGFQIKYYTFMTNYEDYRGNYDIINLPLSTRNNGKFQAETFDCVRDLAKKSMGKLVRYSSDDASKWGKKIAEYGIMQSEWRMIEDLNSVEGGLSKYLGEFKTSDAIINKLIIPRIEERYEKTSSKDDSSLETMLINYAKQFNKQKELIGEREIIEGFKGKLEVAYDDASKLYSLDDEYKVQVALAFAYADAIAVKINKTEEEIQSLEDIGENLLAKKKHIQLEELSAKYYHAKKDWETAAYQLTQVETEKTSIEEQQKVVNQQRLVMECAGYYEKLKEVEAQLIALGEELHNKESESEDHQRLASLSYSVKKAIEALLPNIEADLKAKDIQSEEFEALKKSTEVECTDCKEKLDLARERKSRLEGKLEEKVKATDSYIEKLHILAVRLFGTGYQVSDLDATYKSKEEEKSNVEELQKNNKAKRDELNVRIAQIPDDKAAINENKLGLEKEIQTLNDQLEQYDLLEEYVKSVCQRYTLDFELRFSNYILDFVKNEIKTLQAKNRSLNKQVEHIKTIIDSAKNGNLHIPEAVYQYVNSLGISFQTVEQYLLKQVEKEYCTIDKCIEILDQYPALAFGIMVSDNNYQQLLEDSDIDWLPAVLPIYTYDDMDAVLAGREISINKLYAKYSKEFFLDRDGYLDKKIAEQSGIIEIINQNEEKIVELSDAVNKLLIFSEYTCETRTSIIMKKIAMSQEISCLVEQMKALDTERGELLDKLNQLDSEVEELVGKSIEIAQWFDGYAQLLVLITDEENLAKEIDESEQSVTELIDRSKSLDAKLKSLVEQIDRLNDEIKTLTQQQVDMLAGYDQVKESFEAEIISGEWKSLLSQYQELLKAQNADIAGIKDKISTRSKQKAEYQEEIDKRGCELSLYCDVAYSKDAERKLRDDAKHCEVLIETVMKQYTEATRAESASKANFDNACNALKDIGEPLPISEVGTDFRGRIKNVNEQIKENEKQKKYKNSVLGELARMEGQAKSSLKKYIRPSEIKPIELDTDYQKQFDHYIDALDSAQKNLSVAKKAVEDSLEDMHKLYNGKSVDIIRAIDSLKSLLSNEMRGDRYYTLCEHITANIHTTELRISQIKTDLSDFDKSRQDLIRQCVIQGNQMYDGLKQLASSSKVKVYSKRVQMIKFDIPDAVDENVALQSITNEIEKGTQEIVRKIEDDAPDSDIKKTAKTIVGSNVLLRRYIGSDKIVLKAYKIDQNPENSGYRTWEQTQINNSGAEKFVVYFAIILSMMSYSRNSYGDYDMDGSTSVLILDNPFGPISSKHVLEPMFEIARHFMVQMICLSDISKSDIVSCFDLVIRAIVKKIPFSNKEQLTHPENEEIQHGYYQAEQMRLF